MLKDYLKQQNISMYKLSKTTGVPYATINDISNGRVAIENCRAELLRIISKSLNISMDMLYDISKNELTAYSTHNNKDIKISVSNKTYYASFIYDNECIILPICSVNEDNSFYIDEMAEWTVDGYIRNRKLEDF